MQEEFYDSRKRVIETGQSSRPAETLKTNTMKTTGADQTPLPFNEWREYIRRQILFAECAKLMQEINANKAKR